MVNKVAFIVYRIFRSVYVSFWFYFLPFSILFGSYYVPYWLNYLQDKNATVVNV